MAEMKTVDGKQLKHPSCFPLAGMSRNHIWHAVGQQMMPLDASQGLVPSIAPLVPKGPTGLAGRGGQVGQDVRLGRLKE